MARHVAERHRFGDGEHDRRVDSLAARARGGAPDRRLQHEVWAIEGSPALAGRRPPVSGIWTPSRATMSHHIPQCSIGYSGERTPDGRATPTARTRPRQAE
jgi:hypothetical protein